MNMRGMGGMVLGLALSAAAFGQSAEKAAPAGTASGASAAAPAAAQAPGAAQDQGGRGQWERGRGGFGGGFAGRGLTGTLTEVAADHYTLKSDAGPVYTLHVSADTRFVKQLASGGAGRRGQAGQGGQSGQGGENGGRPQGAMGPENRSLPMPLRVGDVKVGDAINVIGEVNADAKTVEARAIVLMDPERAKQMREMQANYGKTWLMGKVTAIDGVTVTLLGTVDSAPHSFTADENTTFRMRREPITLGDIKVGDVVRAEGAVKDGSFVATGVNSLGAADAGATVPRSGGPAAAPVPQPPPQQ